MADEVDVRGPGEMLRILSTADQEPLVRAHLGGRHQQCLECFLTVLGIGAQIGKIGSIVRKRPGGTMQIRIDMTIKRSDSAGAESSSEFLERAATAVAA